MACIHIKHYPRVKELINSNITFNIDYYNYKKVSYSILPEHHGCGLRNKYGFNKRVDYKRGEQSVLPTNKPYWRRTKNKYKLKRVYNRRYQSEYNIRYLSLVKGLDCCNYRTKKYMHED